jgi:5-methyltetrahydrofolate--homocysteine methyltransferase
MGTRLQAADLTLDDVNDFEGAPTPSTRNTLGCYLVNLGDCDIADKLRELPVKGVAIANRVAIYRGDELGVRTSIG